MRRLPICLLLVAACVLVAGCKDEPEVTAPDDGLDLVLPLAATADQLMSNFVTAYENMDYAAYLEVVDPEFRIYLQPGTIADFKLERVYFDYAEDCDITGNMFTGEAPAPDAAPINGIDFIALNGAGPWVDAEDERFPGAQHRVFEVLFIFHLGAGDSRKDLTVQGRIDVYVKTETVRFEGRQQTRFVLVGQIDDTNDSYAKPNQDATWGEVKALYRTPAEEQR
jgi:hypothetical protein